MPRLKQAPARLAVAPSRLAMRAPVVLGNPLKGLYSTARWAATRRRIKARDLYTCRWPGCGRIGGRLVVDHVQPHRGSEALFWDEDNLQTLCKSPCHDKHKQALEARTRPLG